MTRPRGALLAGLVVWGTLVLLAVAGPWLVPRDPLAIDPQAILQPPSAAHPLGTDSLGRDALARLLHGGRTSLAAGLAATVLGIALGAAAGTAAGLAPRALDALLSRAADVVNAFPPLVGALALLGLAAPHLARVPAALRAGLLVGLFAWPALFRFVRAEVRALACGDAALAAAAVGASPVRVAALHLLPRAVLPALAPASFLAGGAVLAEAALAFLGLGAPPPAPSWGALLNDGMAHVDVAWWLGLFPGACVFLTVLGCHLVGDGLRHRGA